MSQKDELHELILSLTQAEKRYFKVFAGRHVIGEENNYIHLFDRIAALEVYDEVQLLKILGNSAQARHIASEKNYLRKLILKGMRAYNDERDVNATLRNLVADLQFLKGKQQFVLFEKTWKKAWKLASLHERFSTMLDLIQERREVIKETDIPDLPAEIDQIIADRKSTLARQQRLGDYLALYDLCYVRIRNEYRSRGPQLKALLAEVETNHLYQSIEKADSFIARIDFHSVHAFVAQLKGNASEALQHHQALCEEWERAPHEMEDDPSGYLRSLGNLLAVAHQADQYAIFSQVLQKIEPIEPTNPRMKAERFHTIVHYELIYCLNTGDFDRSTALAKTIEQGLVESGDTLGVNRFLMICYNLAILHFFQGEFSQALRWLNRIINENEAESRQDIRHAARLLLMVVHIELGNNDLLNYLYRSIQRYLRKEERLFAFEEAMMEFFNAVQKLPAGKSLAELAKPLNEKLSRIKASNGGACAGLEESLHWARSKADGLPIKHIFLQALAHQS
jgi:tetratricopeptide (TPR) repeat protein